MGTRVSSSGRLETPPTAVQIKRASLYKSKLFRPTQATRGADTSSFRTRPSHLVVGADLLTERPEQDHGHYSRQEQRDHQRVHDGEVVDLALQPREPSRSRPADNRDTKHVRLVMWTFAVHAGDSSRNILPETCLDLSRHILSPEASRTIISTSPCCRVTSIPTRSRRGQRSALEKKKASYR